MKNKLKTIFIVIGGILGVLYLLNPTAGIFEILPDNLPIVGNLDEGAAVVLILAALRVFGWDITNWTGKKSEPKQVEKQ